MVINYHLEHHLHMGQNIPEFTGDKRVTNLGWDRDGQIEILQEQPLPMTVWYNRNIGNK